MLIKEKELKRFFILSVILFSFSTAFVFGQGRVRIPGDTTGRGAKQDSVVYGPETTKYIYESDLKNNRVTYKTVDTLLTGVHNYSRVEALGNGLQYLGTIGSAATSIFPQPPEVIGATSGFNAYDLYYTSPGEIKFYNTKSPFTHLMVTFGGGGRSAVNATFSRNVTPNWNIGVNVRTLSVDKQLGASQSQGDKFTRSYFLNFFTHYQTKNEKYNLMGVLSRMDHKVQESGGIIESEEPGLTEFYEYRNANVWLRDASDREFRFHYHLYHQYSLKDFLQVYHEFNLYHQHNFFFYKTGGDIITPAYFKRIYLDTAQTTDLNKFKLLENEIGIKGNLAALFYRFRFRLRNPQMQYLNPADSIIRDTLNMRNNELYGGFDIRLDLGEKTYLGGSVDYLNTNSYRLEAEFNNPVLKASYIRARALPSYLVRAYLGNHNRWQHNFSPVAYDQIKGSLEYQFNSFYLQPFITATNVNHPIYFRRDTVQHEMSHSAFPVQANGAAQVLSPGFEFHVDFLQNMHMENRIMYSLVSGKAAQAFPVPDWYIFSRLFFMNKYIEDKITLQLGVDMQVNSAYLGYDYDVATQQFFIQQQMYGNEVLTDNFKMLHPDHPFYFVADLFFVMKVRKARLYIKVPHLNQGIPEEAYFASPFYAGQRRTIDMGINWMFFD